MPFLTPERGKQAAQALATPGGYTCQCGAATWRYRTRGSDRLSTFEEMPGGPFDFPDGDGPVASITARRPGRGKGTLRLHRCDGVEALGNLE